jgi:DNA-binding LacI/PurR family transcriptional regulator
VESLDDEHEVSVVRGAALSARELNATLLCVAGGVVADGDPRRQVRNFVFDLLGPSNVEGVLALTSAIGTALGAGGMADWLRRYQGLPVCALGVPVQGLCAVSVDNSSGMREAVRHLVRTHGRQRIAFVRGPAGSTEAEARYDAYAQVLTEEGITLDERWVVEGDFTKPSGARAVRTLLDERRIPAHALDALVASNDYMALGALEELARRNCQVPDAIAVLGFDDVPSARLARPSLSTVRQPAEDLGREGLRQLAAQQGARGPASSRVLPTELLLRRSCGCVVIEGSLASGANVPVAGRGIETSFVQARQIILAELMRAARGTFGAAGSGWETRLLDALIAEVRGGDPGGLSRALAQTLHRLERNISDPGLVQELLSALRRQSLPCVANDPVARDRLEEALHDARLVASDIVLQAETARTRLADERFRAFARHARSAMLDEPSALAVAAAEELPRLGVEACVVAGLNDGADPNRDARVLFGFGPGGRRAGGEVISLRSLPAHTLFHRSPSLRVLLPIVSKGEPLGAALFALSALDGALLEELGDLLGSVLRVSALVRARR